MPEESDNQSDEEESRLNIDDSDSEPSHVYKSSQKSKISSRSQRIKKKQFGKSFQELGKQFPKEYQELHCLRKVIDGRIHEVKLLQKKLERKGAKFAKLKGPTCCS